MRLSSLILSLVLGCLQLTCAQADSCWNVLLVKKGKPLIVRKEMSQVNQNGFYLYRNCVYDIGLISGLRYNARLLDIRQDTLVFQNFMNKALAEKNGQALDTLVVDYRSLAKIYLITDRALGIYDRILLEKYDINVKQDTLYRNIPSGRFRFEAGDAVSYEMVPYLTGQGMSYVYEYEGKTYYYMPVAYISGVREIDTVYRKKSIWFIPPFDSKVDEINGVAIGFLAEPSNFKDSLKINGICFEALTMGWFAPLFGSFLGSDDEVYAEPDPTTVRIKGVMLTAGSIGGKEISGFYAGLTATIVNKLKGFSITGIHTIAQESKGLSISGLRSQVKKVKGVQIALFNSCEELHGVQIGLWNVNNKRSMPIVNWILNSEPRTNNNSQFTVHRSR